MKKTKIGIKKTARKDALPDNVDELKQLVLAAQSLAEEQQSHIRRVEEIVKIFKASKFGKSSEKSPAQTELFDEVEVKAARVIKTGLQKPLNLNKKQQYQHRL